MILRRLGPGLITACVVIGPGSILTSSNVGAANGYTMGWVVLAAVLFMTVYMTLGARWGVIAEASPGDVLAQRAGRWLAALVGLSVFFISAAFQFGNNLGVHSAFDAYVDYDYTIVIFNALSLVFLFGLSNLYQVVERVMGLLVGVMLCAFTANLIFARPDVVALARGLLPLEWRAIDISVLGLVGTTFVITAAYYQAYLVRQKGWTREQLRESLVDARVGAAIMAAITLMLISTSAAVLRGRDLQSVSDVAAALGPLFGQHGQVLFRGGLFAAAYSSFLVNSMIGGFVLADGFGWGSRPQDMAPRVGTAIVLLTGMVLALYVIKTGVKPVPAIVAAQAVTVVAAPLLAGILLWLNIYACPDRQSPSRLLTALAVLGFLLMLAMAWYTAVYKVWPAVGNWRGASS